jgi:SAM-dependent methyltransferase
MSGDVRPPIGDQAIPGRQTSTISSLAEAKRRVFRRGQATGDILLYLAGQESRGRLLELPAGEGRTTREILRLGFDVVPADLFPHYYKNESPPCVKADMGKPLPFDDDSFDFVLCQEGIEHIESPLSFTRECARILKKGGKLILTTPNVLHMTSRIAYLLVGHRTYRRGLINEYQTLLGRDGDEMHHGHAWHWRYPVLRYALRLSGFQVPPPLTTKYSLSSVLLSIPMLPVLHLAHWYAIRQGLAEEHRKEIVPQARRACDEVRRHVLSRALLWGRKVMIIAERQ